MGNSEHDETGLPNMKQITYELERYLRIHGFTNIIVESSTTFSSNVMGMADICIGDVGMDIIIHAKTLPSKDIINEWTKENWSID